MCEGLPVADRRCHVLPGVAHVRRPDAPSESLGGWGWTRWFGGDARCLAVLSVARSLREGGAHRHSHGNLETGARSRSRHPALLRLVRLNGRPLPQRQGQSAGRHGASAARVSVFAGSGLQLILGSQSASIGLLRGSRRLWWASGDERLPRSLREVVAAEGPSLLGCTRHLGPELRPSPSGLSRLGVRPSPASCKSCTS